METNIPKTRKKTKAPSGLTLLKKIVADLEAREKALQEENRHLRELYDQATLGYQSLDENGCFIEVNQAWLDILGYSIEEIVGKNFRDFLHPDWKDHFKANFPWFKAMGDIFGVEFEMVKKDGCTIRVALNCRSSKDSQGQCHRIYCVLHDITRQKQAEQKYRLVFENALEAILISQDQRLVLVNPAAVKIIGYSAKELTSRTFARFIHPDDREMVVDHHLKRLRSEEVFSSYSFRVLRQDGTVKWVEQNGSLITWNGKPATLNFLTDITERKRSEEELLKRTEDLVRYNKMMVGRELKMVDLKKEINMLLTKYGEKEKYNLNESSNK
jgi:PAS domain S-box-containing protein